MREIYSREEIKILAEHLGFASLHKFMGFLANYNNLDEFNEDELDNEAFAKEHEEIFVAELNKVKQKLNPLERESIQVLLVEEVNSDNQLIRIIS